MCNYAFSNGDGLCQSVRGINYFVIKFWFDKSWLLSSSVLSVIRYLRMHYNCHLSEYYIACNLILEWCKRITKIMFAKKNDILKWTNLLIESINELSDLLQTNGVFNKIIIRCFPLQNISFCYLRMCLRGLGGHQTTHHVYTTLKFYIHDF